MEQVVKEFLLALEEKEPLKIMTFELSEELSSVCESVGISLAIRNG